MVKFSTRIGLAVRNWKIPRDGTRRFLYDIWQPLTLLVPTTCFTAAFFTSYDPYASTDGNSLFFCNADGNTEKTDHEYRPFGDPQLYVTVNVAFGQFAFSTVKVIDAIWDAIMERIYREISRNLMLHLSVVSIAVKALRSLIHRLTLRRLLHLHGACRFRCSIPNDRLISCKYRSPKSWVRAA